MDSAGTVELIGTVRRTDLAPTVPTVLNQFYVQCLQCQVSSTVPTVSSQFYGACSAKSVRRTVPTVPD